VSYARTARAAIRLPGDDATGLDLLLFQQDDVISRRQALRYLTPKTLEHRLTAGRWSIAHRGVYLAGPGPVRDEQRPWIAVLAAGAGRRALLGGVSALTALGLRGQPAGLVHVLIPARRNDLDPPPGVIVHRTRTLPRRDIHQLGLPPGTMPARSLVDAARWASSDRSARAVIAAAFQQRMVTRDEVERVLAGLTKVDRRALILETLVDAEGGSHSIAELDFVDLCRRYGLPTPTRQSTRRDRAGRQRYRDAYFEEWRLHVEVDGGQHMDVESWWADMRRQNDLWLPGDRVLRFPAWALRHEPDEVARQVRDALIAAGWRPSA
jgi:hypothetical protein